MQRSFADSLLGIFVKVARDLLVEDLVALVDVRDVARLIIAVLLPSAVGDAAR